MSRIDLDPKENRMDQTKLSCLTWLLRNATHGENCFKGTSNCVCGLDPIQNSLIAELGLGTMDLHGFTTHHAYKMGWK